ncbi:hypothetical protein IFM89_038903 [Coptis chinensis]|uniref:Ubiquitin-like protease family profile domain-containing protein n=1 Tax=Coptis chinensis TaxID=261450 RepID=A0A835J0D6_9MAGN|nr:hypothetical protein IFM89_038903 [Coptis chinensis]
MKRFFNSKGSGYSSRNVIIGDAYKRSDNLSYFYNNPVGILMDLFPLNFNYVSACNRNAKVGSFIENRQWKIPQPFMVYCPDLIQGIEGEVKLHTGEDEVIWDFIVDFNRRSENRSTFKCLLGNGRLVFAWCMYLNTEQNSKPTNNNRHYYYPYLMGASKQLTSAARAIHLDNDISKYRRWFVPVVDSNHLSLYVFDPSARKVVILDSLADSASYICGGTDSMKSMVTKMHYTLSLIGDFHAKNCGVKDWVIEKCKDVPQQYNGFDCGVFMMKFMELWDWEKLVHWFDQVTI